MSRYATRRRHNGFAVALAVGATMFGLAWLVLILGVLLWNGIGGLSLAVFTQMTPPPGWPSGPRWSVLLCWCLSSAFFPGTASAGSRLPALRRWRRRPVRPAACLTPLPEAC